DSKGEYISSKSTLIIRNIEHKYFLFFLAMLNSKLISYYVKDVYSTMGIDGGINFNVDMIENIPIPKLKDNDIIELSNLVERYVLYKNIEDIKLIDNFIYKLYDLSENEINIIENN